MSRNFWINFWWTFPLTSDKHQSLPCTVVTTQAAHLIIFFPLPKASHIFEGFPDGRVIIMSRKSTTLVSRTPLLKTPSLWQSLSFFYYYSFHLPNKWLKPKEADALTEMIIRSCWRSALYRAPLFFLFCIPPDGTLMSQSCHCLNYREEGTQGLSKISSENLNKVIVIKWTAVAQNGLRNAVIYVSQ